MTNTKRHWSLHKSNECTSPLEGTVSFGLTGFSSCAMLWGIVTSQNLAVGNLRSSHPLLVRLNAAMFGPECYFWRACRVERGRKGTTMILCKRDGRMTSTKPKPWLCYVPSHKKKLTSKCDRKIGLCSNCDDEEECNTEGVKLWYLWPSFLK